MLGVNQLFLRTLYSSGHSDSESRQTRTSRSDSESCQTRTSHSDSESHQTRTKSSTRNIKYK